MKKIMILALAFTGILLSGCASDDDNALEKPDPIIGKWLLSVQLKNDKVDYQECSDTDYLNFKENKSIELQSGSNSTGTCTNVVKNGTWSREFTSKYKYVVDGIEMNLFTKFSNTTVVKEVNEGGTIKKVNKVVKQMIIEDVVGDDKINRVYFMQ